MTNIPAYNALPPNDYNKSNLIVNNRVINSFFLFWIQYTYIDNR